MGPVYVVVVAVIWIYVALHTHVYYVVVGYIHPRYVWTLLVADLVAGYV